jgi:hypothetical protein
MQLTRVWYMPDTRSHSLYTAVYVQHILTHIILQGNVLIAKKASLAVLGLAIIRSVMAIIWP